MKKVIFPMALLGLCLCSCNNNSSKEASFDFNYHNPICYLNDSIQLSTDSKEKVNWSVDDKENSYIDEDGNFYGYKEGTYKVNASLNDGSSKSIDVTVSGFDNINEHNLTIDSNVYYTSTNNYDQSYDLYYKKDHDFTKMNKIVLFIHGGAWIAGSSKEYDNYSRMFANAGYIVANLRYTLIDVDVNDFNNFKGSSTSVITQLDDITLSLTNLKEKLINLGANESNLEMSISGDSAGGHLSLLYSYSRVNEWPIPIKFAFTTVAPVIFDYEYWFGDKSTSMFKMFGAYSGQFIQMLSGKEVSSTDCINHTDKANEAIDLISPVKHLTKDSIPAITWYGELDNIIGNKQIDACNKAFEDANVKHVTIVSKDGTHTVRNDNANDNLKNYYKAFVNFSNLYF